MRVRLSFMILLCAASQASALTISDQRCVKANSQSVIHAITDYQSYSDIPESRMTMMTMELLKMGTPQVLRQKQQGSNDDVIVLTELVPLSLAEFHPKIILRCEVTRESSEKSRHECHAMKDEDFAEYGLQAGAKKPFGLSDFHSELEIDSASARCPGQTELAYKLNIEPNDSDVEQIRKAWIETNHISALAPAVNQLFEQRDLFFEKYYEGFYMGWVKKLEAK